jgi:hypothetical protein
VGLDARREEGEGVRKVVKRGGGNASRSRVTWRSKRERGGRKLRGDVENEVGGSRTRWKGCSEAPVVEAKRDTRESARV